MANNKEKVRELINSLYTMIDEAKGGFGGMCRIDRDKALDLLDEVTRLFPVEIDESERIINRRNEMLDQAEREAEEMRRSAQEEAAAVMQKAETYAADTVNQAEERARKIIDTSELQNRIKAKAEGIIESTKKLNAEKVAQAEAEAAQTIANAERRADALKRAANEYCEDVLRRSQEALSEALGEIQESHERFMELLEPQKKMVRPEVFDAEQED